MKNGVIWAVASAIGFYHMFLHYLGANFFTDYMKNTLYFVTPGMVIGFVLYKKYFEPKLK